MDTEMSPSNNQTTEEKCYTQAEVMALIAKFQASASDYLIQTYFKIFKITNGLFYEKYQRRFNHLVFNNLDKIIGDLTTTAFAQKSQQTLEQDLSATNYVSCIFSFLKCQPHPVFVQYFNPKNGIEYRLLGYAPTPTGLSSVVTQHQGVLNKIVGYCGDFSHKEGISTGKSDHFASLSILSDNKIKYLPYSDGFIARLFDLLTDYLPADVCVSLTKLGETFMGMCFQSQFAHNLASKYQNWLQNKESVHILLSDFAEDVINHLDTISSYLIPFRCLSKSIQTILGHVLHRFLLVFMREIYLKVDELKLTENSAVVYYFQMVQIRDLFKLYEESHHIPSNAMVFFNKQIDGLIDSKTINPTDDQPKLEKLTKEILEITSFSYTRAIKYIDCLLEQFINFESFSWILLKTSIDENLVHESYHVINEDNCAQCPVLLQEVKNINLALRKVSLLEMEGTVASKWVNILRNCGDATMVTRLLEYLLSLPASHGMLPISMDGFEAHCEQARVQKMVQFNMRSVPEEVVDDIETFLGGEIASEARSVIKNCKISLIID